MEDVRIRLLAECLDEREATQLIASTLGDLGVTDLTIQTDAPVAYPIAERDAYLRHTDNAVQSGAPSMPLVAVSQSSSADGDADYIDTEIY